MQELRYILVALGGIAIAALLIHGLWSSRKNRQTPIKEKPQGRMESKSRDRGADTFDSDGIGQVRVLGGRRGEPKLRDDESRQPDLSRRPAPAFAEPGFDDEDDDAELPPPVVRKPAARPAPAPVYQPPVYEEDEEEFEEPIVETLEEEVPSAPVRKPAQVIRRTPVHRSRPQREPMLHPLDDEPEPAYATAPAFSARAESEPEYQPESRPTHAPGTNRALLTPVPVYEEPAYEEPVYEAPVMAAPMAEVAPAPKTWHDVYVINLMARPGYELQGAALIASLMALGFKFGEMEIFHRHEDLGGKGEVLFSMINMVKPGTFNPYRMEQFSTPGVSLFMQLPLRSNAAFAFEHMLQAADQLASDLDAMLTDADRSPLSDETIARCRQELASYEASRD